MKTFVSWAKASFILFCIVGSVWVSAALPLEQMQKILANDTQYLVELDYAGLQKSPLWPKMVAAMPLLEDWKKQIAASAGDEEFPHFDSIAVGGNGEQNLIVWSGVDTAEADFFDDAELTDIKIENAPVYVEKSGEAALCPAGDLLLCSDSLADLANYFTQPRGQSKILKTFGKLPVGAQFKAVFLPEKQNLDELVKATEIPGIDKIGEAIVVGNLTDKNFILLLNIRCLSEVDAAMLSMIGKALVPQLALLLRHPALQKALDKVNIGSKGAIVSAKMVLDERELLEILPVLASLAGTLQSDADDDDAGLETGDETEDDDLLDMDIVK